MKVLQTLLFMMLTLLSLSATALTVQSGNYDKTFSDPGLREDADQDYQDDKDAYQEDPSEVKQNAQQDQANFQARSSGHR